MQKYNHKIKAFTLSEMIVVLMLTIIVVGLAFSVLNLVQKQMGGMSENYEYKNEINLLKQALWIDFGTYSNISIDSKTNILRFANEIEYTDYIFEEDWIVRGKDTFNLKLSERLFYFDGVESSDAQIDAIKLITVLENENKSIFLYQENAASEYMY